MMLLASISLKCVEYRSRRATIIVNTLNSLQLNSLNTYLLHFGNRNRSQSIPKFHFCYMFTYNLLLSVPHRSNNKQTLGSKPKTTRTTRTQHESHLRHSPSSVCTRSTTLAMYVRGFPRAPETTRCLEEAHGK